MNPLLAQLGAIIQRESAKIKCVHRQIVFLRDELHSMSAALEMVSESEEENPRVKEWMSQLRELSYDVEDCIEIFTHCLGNVDTCDGFIHKIINKVTTLKAHYNIGNQINELKERALEVSDRRKRYKLDPSASSPRSLVIDPRLPALFEETDRLVGIDTQMDKLVKLLTDGIDSYSQRKFLKSSSPLTEDQNQNIAKMQENHYLKAFEYLQLVHMNREYLQNRSLQIFTAEYPEETVMISPEGFQHLEDFHFRPSMYCRTKKSMLSLVFEEGAMPRLKRLWFRFVLHDTLSAYGVGFDFGISLLLSLKRLWISINCHGARVSEVETARVTIKNAAALLPNRPRHEIHIFGDEEMVKDKERR
ncbi:hypothetical protein PR202_ga20755 [Eleusine coracana subsp. coracana]|uniref:Rx N-terminal domain-containing protein n=1 Tax=Eleusine coracana subsp. coracana TaxID=191504 RepID=A0AAV5CZV7_ELECO|nr:hypothetical protein PR202_ga20755 [Eleusine coracana subsp. coracana]